MRNKYVLLVMFLTAGGVAALATAADEPTTVVGVRGLQETSEDINTSLRDYPAIDQLSAIRIKPEEVDQFIRDGGLQ